MSFLDVKHFKMDTPRGVLKKSYWMGKSDLSLSKVSSDGRTGTTSSKAFPLALQPCLKPTVTEMRNMGVRLIIYLDDILTIISPVDRGAKHT